MDLELKDRFAVAMGRSFPEDKGWGRGEQPVIVFWQEAQDYADWLSRQTGQRYRLPTESEWEYAARSEGKDDIWAGTSDEGQLKYYAVYAANSENRPAPIGKDQGRKPNTVGLYDMSGNVWEWVEDCWHDNYKDAPTDGSAWLEAGDNGDCHVRVVRGGSWNDDPEGLRVSTRNWNGFEKEKQYPIGFRLVKDIP